jgi:peptidoglycan/LPS O-acetylase OafA/YrhL
MASQVATANRVERSGALDAVRGLAITLVVAHHWFRIPFGWTGVDLFFILSGYLIGGMLIDNRSSSDYFSTFYFRRAFRILPLYWLLLAISFTNPVACPYRWQYFTFTQNFSWASGDATDCVSTRLTWSLDVEEQFYLLLPVLIRFVPLSALPKLCLCLIALAPAARGALVLGYGNALSAYALLPGRMDALFVGTLIAWIVRQPTLMAKLQKRLRLLWTIAAIGAAEFTLIGLGGGFDWQAPLMWTIGYSVIAVAYGSAMLAIIVGGWRPPPGFPLCSVGIGAYSIYLFHAVVPGAVDAIYGGRWFFVKILIDFAVVAGVAVTFWWLIERPLIRWARGIWKFGRASKFPVSKTPVAVGVPAE